MIERKYSTFWPRFCAGFVDGLIFGPIAFGYYYLFRLTESAALRVLEFVVHSCLFLAYSIWMHGKYGQTLGKMACKVIVLDLSERPLSMKQAVLRDILSLVLLPISFAIEIPRILHGADIFHAENSSWLGQFITYSNEIWFWLEVVTMLTNKKRRALHDFIAHSVVIRKEEPIETKLLEPNSPA